MDERPPHHHARRASRALDDPRERQHGEVGGQRTQHRTRQRQHQAQQQHRATTVPVRQRPIQQLQHTVGSHIPTERELHPRLVGVEDVPPLLH